MRILLAEADTPERERLQGILQEAGYEVAMAKNGEETMAMLEAGPYDWDAMILSLRLPPGDGLAVVRRIRENGCPLPVLLLAGKDEGEQGAAGLDAGADDFLLAPASRRELLARLGARLRGRAEKPAGVLRVEDLELDAKRRTVRRKGERIDLTPRQFAVLEVLMLESPNPVSKQTIIAQVWGEDFPKTNVVNVVINQLRNKIDRSDSAVLVQTVRGFGYALCKKAE
jgi:two-component system copper resistance phosphate regulon response regulator CusR